MKNLFKLFLILFSITSFAQNQMNTLEIKSSYIRPSLDGKQRLATHPKVIGFDSLSKTLSNNFQNINVSQQIFARNIQGGDLGGKVFGQEYLYAWIEKMRAGNTPIMVLAGDSKTSGDAISDANYLFQNLYKKIITQNYHSITVYNDAVSGTNTSQWRTTYLAAQIARNPDIMIVNYGFNDGANNRTNFESDYSSALATIRASRTVNQTSIVILPPISGNDTPNGRDSTWFKQINPILKKLARQYLCTYIDTYASYIDAINGGAWYDDPYGDGRHIHQKEQINLQVASLVCDAIIPSGLKSVLGSTTFENTLSSYYSPINSSLVSTYPKGLSMYRSGVGFPQDGAVFTLRQADGVWLQFNPAYTSTGLVWRNGGSSGWQAWRYPVTTDNTGNLGVGVNPSDRLHILDTNPVFRMEGSTGNAYLSQNGSSLGFGINRNPSTGAHADITKTSAQINMTSSTTGSDILFYVGLTPNSLSGTDNIMTIKGATRRVGINTTTPTSSLQVVGLPTYADNTAALAGGLTAGAFYRTSTGVLMVTF